jgi:NADH-quinone oxidoreductase subunit L
MSPTTTAWLTLASPLAGSILIGLGYKKLPGKAAGIIGSSALGLSFLFAVLTFIGLQDKSEQHRQLISSLYGYVSTDGVGANMSILVDPLSVLMILVVSGVSMLIHIYATAYMWSDKGYARFFAYLNFFVFSMLLLILASNFLLLIVGWAFVGAASYLLISFWYRRTTATSAGIKAFVINVVGDIGLVLGTYFIFRQSGSLDFLTTFHQAPQLKGTDLTIGCLFLLVGAFAKSAQVPFHTWLPDAMEGPTPVSALIHAATMVTAGVYLIARMHPLFQQAPVAANTGAIIGCLTLVIAGTIGLVVVDLKRVIAYSTMSQIGYMVMAVSVGAYDAGLFHLMTHAFFKALLFMGAGSVIAAMAGEQSLDKMGGFRKAMPFTFVCMAVGALTLSGVPPFSGYFSKDDILAGVGSLGGWHWALYAAGYVTAFITAIYTWRMMFRAFFGPPCPEAEELATGHLHHAEAHTNPSTGEVEDTDVGFPGAEHHIAEREPLMKISMGLLAFLAVIGGLVEIPYVTNGLDDFLDPTFADSTIRIAPSDGLIDFGLILGATLGVLGIAVAYKLWVLSPELPGKLQQRFAPLHKLFVNKWYFDELIDIVIVRPSRWFGRWALHTFERVVIDGALVGGASSTVRAGSTAARAFQSGFLRSYAAVLLLGVIAVVLYFLIAS